MSSSRRTVARETSLDDMKLADLSEAQLVSHFRDYFPVGERTLIGIGDDCAQIAAPEGSFIVTTDVMVEDQHFHLSWSTGYEVGARVAAQNLADIDAMGGRPTGLVASVVAPRQMDADVFLDVVRGLGDRARQVGAGVVGGDLSAGEKLTISVTAFGYCPGPVVRRDGALPGDVIAVSGTLGFSYAGLDLLAGGHIDPRARGVGQLGELEPFVRTYRAPDPPLGSGVAAASAGARAMMDLSDGPTADAARIAKASGVVIEFDRPAIEREAWRLQAPALICRADPVKWVLQGGEEHGMIAAFPPDVRLPEGFRVIGQTRACESDEESCAMFDGEILRGAWDHFSPDSVH